MGGLQKRLGQILDFTSETLQEIAKVIKDELAERKGKTDVE